MHSGDCYRQVCVFEMSLLSSVTTSCLLSLCSIYKYSTLPLGRAPVDGYSGHSSSVFYSKGSLSGDGQYLLSGSGCGSAYIWQVCVWGDSFLSKAWFTI